MWYLWLLYVLCDILGFATKTQKIRTVWQKARIVTKFKSVKLWHFGISQNVTKCITLLKSLLQNNVYLSRWDFARNAYYKSNRRSFWSGFQTEIETGFVPVTLNVWPFVTFMTVTQCHNLEFVNHFVTLEFLVVLAKQIWLRFGQKRHKWPHIQVWGTNLFCFCFLGKGSEQTKSSKTYQKVTSVSGVCLESGSKQLLVELIVLNPPPGRVSPRMIFFFGWFPNRKKEWTITRRKRILPEEQPPKLINLGVCSSGGFLFLQVVALETTQQRIPHPTGGGSDN